MNQQSPLLLLGLPTGVEWSGEVSFTIGNSLFNGSIFGVGPTRLVLLGA